MWSLLRSGRWVVLLAGLAACDGKPEPVEDDAVTRAPKVVPDEDTPAAPAPAPQPSGSEGGSAARPKKPVTPPPTSPDEGTGDDETKPPPTTPPAAGKKGRPISPKPSGITQVSNTSWTVSSSLVDRWKDNPYTVSNVREEGDGWALVGVRTRAAYHLGMRNGDVILEANGHKLNTRTQLLMAYMDLKNDTEFTVVFVRKGQRMVHHYSIVK